jgi:hypothetical protein
MTWPLPRYEFAWQPSRDGWPVWSGVKQVPASQGPLSCEQGDELQFLAGRPLDHPEEYLIGQGLTPDT